MKQYLVGNKEMEFDSLIFISPAGVDANDGLTEDTPVKTIAKAKALSAGANRAIVFLPGEYNDLKPTKVTFSANCGEFFTIGTTAITYHYIGQAEATIFNLNFALSTWRDAAIGTKYCKFYRMHFKISLKATKGIYTNCLTWNPVNIAFYNCCFECASTTNTLAISMGTSAQTGFYHNCLFKFSGRNIASADYGSTKNTLTNCLLDWAYQSHTNASSNILSRTITDDDILTGSAADLVADDNSIIGLYGGDFAWGEGTKYYRITVQTLLENGIVLEQPYNVNVREGENFTLEAKLISGYSYVGYKIADGTLVNASPIMIDNIQSDLTINLIYKDKISAGTCEGVPAGMVMYFTDTTAPKGWLKCDGSAVSRVNYQNLFNVVGTKFGAGDGKMTFNLPNLKGEFIRGFDDTGEVDADRAFGSKQKATVQAFDPTKSGIYMIGLYNSVDDNAAAFPGMIGAEQVDLSDYPGVAAAGTDSGTSVRDDEVCFAAVRPRNVALLPCIKH